jgi:hypothetical protein
MDDGALTGTTRVHSMIRVHEGAARYLFAVRDAGANDELVFSTGDANFDVAGGADTFAANGSRYGMVAYGGFIYVGNGESTDEIKRVPFAGTAVDIAALGVTNVTGAATAIVADTTASLFSGNYSYCWAIYNSSTQRWISRGVPAQVNLSATRSRITFTAPSTGAGTNQLYRLFVAPVNLPIEFAHDQNIAGIGAGGTIIVSDITVNSTPVPSAQSVIRTGRFLRTHLNRLWISGDQSNKTKVYASSILLPGLEQNLLDQFNFFPANAVIPMPEEITGISPVTVGTTQDQPQGPMAIFSETKTWLWFGDILGDPNAYFIPLSGEMGCISNDTLIPVRDGLIACGRDSVYLIRPDSAAPIDIGWPISPQIKAIPRAVRADCHAIYHNGFYKLAIIPPGATTATREWWLDLRNGLTNPPSWWGPHVTPAFTCKAKTRLDVAEDDRAFGAVGAGTMLLLDQPNSYQDNGSNIVSVAITQQLDDRKPFLRKQFRRVRVNGKAEPNATLTVTAQTNGGLNYPADPLVISGSSGGTWDSGDWEIDEWGSSFFDEAESILEPRPVGVSSRFQLGHTSSTRVDLRDFEVRYEPLERMVE